MRSAFRLGAAADPEERFVVSAEAGVGGPARLLRRHFHENANAKRLKGMRVEGSRSILIGDSKADIVNDGWVLPSRQSLTGRLVAPAQERAKMRCISLGEGAGEHALVGGSRR